MSNCQFNQPFKLYSGQDLSRFSTRSARKLVTRAQAEELDILPLTIIDNSKDTILFIAAKRDDPELVQKMEFITGHKVKIYETSEQSIKKGIFAAYCGDEEPLKNIVEDSLQTPEIASKDLLPFRTSGQASDLLATLLEYCIAQHATDLHLIPEKDALYGRLRLPGRELTLSSRICSLKLYSQLLQRLKVLAKLDITNKQYAQEGKILIPTSYGEVFGRVSILPTVQGEKTVIRFSGHHNTLTLDELKLNLSLRTELNKLTIGAGLALICGAVGSGKTTTLYAIMEHFSKDNKTLVSIEDPVEKIVPWMSQTEVKHNLSYETAIKAVLRQDPDVIMIGEIRDSQVAKEGIKAALSGHLILTTIHTDNSLQAVHRLSGFGIDKEILSQALRLVVAQKLERSLCDNCKVFDLKGTNLLGGEVYKEVGCGQCKGSGYYGVCVVTDYITSQGSIHISFLDSLISHVREGNISAQQYEKLKACYESFRTAVSPKCLHDNI